MTSENQCIALEIGSTFLNIAGLKKSGDRSFELIFANHVELNLPFLMEEIYSDQLLSGLSSVILPYIPADFSGCSLCISYSNQSSMLKSIKKDPMVSEEFILEQLEWELLTTSNRKINEFSIVFPDSINQTDQLVLAMPKDLLNFSKRLAEKLDQSLDHVGLNILHLSYLLEFQNTEELSNAFLIVANDQLVEVAVLINDQFDHVRLFRYDDDIDVNDLNINLRKLMELTAQFSRGPSQIYLSGVKASRELAELIANAIQLPVELVDGLNGLQLTPELESDEALNQKKSFYSVCLGAALQI